MNALVGNPSNSFAIQTGNQKITPIIFKGKASEYFGIWIVNLLLSLVTLGVYSAWAKVRRKKYFYNNTLIDNVGFDYHANPIAILKGRIIALILFALYVYGKGSSPVLAGILVLLFFLFLPWLIVRGSIFNSRNTSHRGLRFDFVGTVNKAARVFIGLPMLTIFTFGLIWPYIAHEKSQFLMSNHRFGLSQFNMRRVVKGFYKIYLIVFLLPVIGILAAVAIPAYQAYLTKAKAVATPHAALSIPNVQAFAPIAAPMMLAANEEASPAQVNPNQVERLYSDNAPVEIAPAKQNAEQAEPAGQAGDMNADKVAPAKELGEITAAQQAIDDVANEPQEMTPEEQKAQDQPVEDLIKKEQEQAAQDKMKEWLTTPFGVLAGLGGALLYGLFIFSFLGYFQSRISNLVWNNTTLDKLSFKSSLRARDFIWLYLTNMLAIVFSFGLATPWAQIRMARYRASKLHIIGDVDFDQFVGDKKAEVKATGEEIAEMFDVDLSFG
ncbi:MAG: DUF898 family protein [Bdellovibrio sp.]|nr:DUF898 family protein [Methylotenera sp.]